MNDMFRQNWAMTVLALPDCVKFNTLMYQIFWQPFTH